MSNSRKPSCPHSSQRTTSRPFRSIASRMTPAHHLAVREAADAELRGDAATALARHRSVPMFAQSGHGDRLQQLADVGDAAPGWLIARWLTVQTSRPAWTGAPTGSQAGPSQALRLVVPAIYGDHIPFEVIGCEHPEQVVAWISARDWVVRQVDVYELGKLRTLLEQHATAEVLGRAGRVAEWVDAPMGGYRVVGESTPGALRLVDLATGADVDVLDLGSLELLGAGSHVIGRVVPVDEAPGRMFEWRPLPVDRGTAEAVAKSPVRWLMVLRMKVRAGRLPVGFSHLPDTSLVTDLDAGAWLTLIGRTPGDLGGRHPHDCAEEALDEVLRLAVEEPEALAGVRHHVAELLLAVELTPHACLARATPDRLAAWRALADVVVGPARGRCVTMAMWCDAAA